MADGVKIQSQSDRKQSSLASRSFIYITSTVQLSFVEIVFQIESVPSARFMGGRTTISRLGPLCALSCGGWQAHFDQIGTHPAITD